MPDRLSSDIPGAGLRPIMCRTESLLHGGESHPLEDSSAGHEVVGGGGLATGLHLAEGEAHSVRGGERQAQLRRGPQEVFTERERDLERALSSSSVERKEELLSRVLREEPEVSDFWHRLDDTEGEVDTETYWSGCKYLHQH